MLPGATWTSRRALELQVEVLRSYAHFYSSLAHAVARPGLRRAARPQLGLVVRTPLGSRQDWPRLHEGGSASWVVGSEHRRTVTGVRLD